MAEQRSLPVPDGLEGERLDAALSRLFGFSRTRAAELIVAGDVLVDGLAAAKSDRVHAGAWLEVTLPPPPVAPMPVAEPVPGMKIVYEDDDIVVVNKPIGVAAHPTTGWTGPTVLGGLLGAGHTGRDQRRGRAPGHRAPPGRQHHRRDGRGQERARLLPPQARLQGAHGRQALPRAGPGASRPVARHRGRADRPAPSGDGRWAVVAGGKESVTHYDTIEAFRAASLLDIKLETGRTHQIRVHMSALRHPCVGDLMYGADPTLAARLGVTRQWLHAVSLAFEHPATGEWVSFTTDYPEDLSHALKIVGQRVLATSRLPGLSRSGPGGSWRAALRLRRRSSGPSPEPLVPAQADPRPRALVGRLAGVVAGASASGVPGAGSSSPSPGAVPRVLSAGRPREGLPAAWSRLAGVA